MTSFVIHLGDSPGGAHPHFALSRTESEQGIWLMPGERARGFGGELDY
jgi:hypothetical protein